MNLISIIRIIVFISAGLFMAWRDRYLSRRVDTPATLEYIFAGIGGLILGLYGDFWINSEGSPSLFISIIIAFFGGGIGIYFSELVTKYYVNK